MRLTERNWPECQDAPTDTNVIAHSQAKAVYTRAKVESIRKSWQENTEILNLEKDSKKLSNPTRSLNEESPRVTKIVLEFDSTLSAGREAANILARVY
jgi:transposase-like protein